MEEKKDVFGMLELLPRPAFCAADNRIVRANSAAQALLLRCGDDVEALLETGREEYRTFTGGCLCLTLRLPPQSRGACVVRMGDMDVFLLDPPAEEPQLRALALAAQELRRPLSGMMAAAGRVSPADEASAEQAAILNRGLYQLLRLVGNMSDACALPASARLEQRSVGQILNEVMEKAEAQLFQAGIAVHYTPMADPAYGPADWALLERAILNLLSNAVKFTPPGGRITVVAARRGNTVRVSVEDTGSGMDQELLGTAFSRYLREPGLGDSRFGLGLGLHIVRCAAAGHGGTVLIDRPPAGGTRVTMTISLHSPEGGVLRSPVVLPDRTGGWDHGLVELSDCLPLSAYRPEKPEK